MSRPLAALTAAILLAAAPAAAQSSSAVANALVSTADLCIRVFQGRGSFESGLDSLGYDRTSSGGRVKPVAGGTLIAASMGTGNLGGPVKLCEITASPGPSDKSVLRSLLNTRAQSYSLPTMPAGPLNGGGYMEGWANQKGQKLIVLAITDRPNNGKPTTSVSLFWR